MTRTSRLKLLGLAPFALLLAFTASAFAAPGPPWQSPGLQDHPLVGRIWQPEPGRFVTPDRVSQALSAAPFVLLGEKHDNADHHRIQAWLLAELTHHGRKPAVAWEMFSQDQGRALADFLASRPRDAAKLGPAVGWDRSGWPDWSIYQPIAAAALAAGLPLLPASLPRDKIRGLARHGLKVLDADEIQSMQLDKEIPKDHRTAIREEVIEVHCRQLPETMIDPMVRITTAKDAFMARRLRDGASLSGVAGAVLIAGNGHVRRDRGVPWHLARQAPGQRVLTVGIQEVSEGRDDPADYAAVYDAEGTPFDFVWFTPRVDSEDPCAIYAEQLEKAREKHLQQKSE